MSSNSRHHVVDADKHNPQDMPDVGSHMAPVRTVIELLASLKQPATENSHHVEPTALLTRLADHTIIRHGASFG